MSLHFLIDHEIALLADSRRTRRHSDGPHRHHRIWPDL